MKWTWIVRTRKDGKIRTEFRLRNDGRWMMWSVNKNWVFLTSMKKYLSGKALLHSENHNSGGMSGIQRHIEKIGEEVEETFPIGSRRELWESVPKPLRPFISFYVTFVEWLYQ